MAFLLFEEHLWTTLASIVVVGGALVGAIRNRTAVGGAARAAVRFVTGLPERVTWRWITPAIVVAIGLAVSAAIVLGGDRDRDRGPYPDEEEQALLHHIPPDIRRGCERLETESPSDRYLTAKVVCAAFGGANYVYYYQFKSLSGLEERYDARRERQGVSGGQCPRARYGEAGYDDAVTTDAGRVLCYSSDDAAWITWTNFQLNIWASAVNTSDLETSLHDWWGDHSGYVHLPRRARFPNQREAALLGHVPKAAQGSCIRAGRTATLNGTVAGMRCRHKGVYVWYYRFQTRQGLIDHYNAIASAEGFSESGNCLISPAFEGTYTQGKRTTGRYFCYSEGEQRVFQWTHPRLRIYAWASAELSNRRMYENWQSAGPA